MGAALFAGSVRAESAYRLLAAGDLAALTNRFEPGDVVLLPNATWTDTTLTFRGKGTPEKPITLRATEPGRFILAGKSSLIIDGEWLVVEGLTLKDAGIAEADGITLKGRHNRLTASVVDGNTHKHAVRLFGTRHRVDHCYLAGKTSEGPTLQIEVDAKEPNYHQIDSNHFGYRPPLGRNGGETMRIGYSHQSMSNSRTTVERNLFEQCDGEIEIISSKSGENVYRGNTFRACAGMLT
ncbi:MAG: polysaccharide lyase 6 family protein, partial [Opitutaceae bacterium]|nr:polysaccharide lyase 6 family protein [Opitutaceae bacterium]